MDDLERIKESINFEEVFGIIDELKTCEHVKVILASNIDEMTNTNRNILNRYYEKVLDRTYDVTERASKIDWEYLKINTDFIEKFLQKNHVKNIRTLQKSQKFYDDVKLFCEDIDDNDFMSVVRQICFAIVVESINKLYYKEPDNNETDRVRSITLTIVSAKRKK